MSGVPHHCHRLKAYLFCSVYKDCTFSLIAVHMCMVLPCHSLGAGLSYKCINAHKIEEEK